MKISRKIKKIIMPSFFIGGVSLLSVLSSISCTNDETNNFTEEKDNSSNLPPLPNLPYLPNDSANNKPQIGGPTNTLPTPSLTKFTYRNNQINVVGTRIARITKRNIDRKINNEIYDTDILKEYGSEFRYPAWNYNYESGNNRYKNINGKQVDQMQAVYEERVNWKNSSGQLKNSNYRDEDFILNEIEKGTLKKHPAADVWFEQRISDDEKAIEKYFSIPSSLVGNTALGLYIPPGEIATIKISDSTLTKMKAQGINNLNIVINSSFWDNRGIGDSGQVSNRMPYVKTSFNLSLDKISKSNNEFRFGSPFGGTVSIGISSKIKSNAWNEIYQSFDNYDFTVSGCLEVLTYSHGLTTNDEWNNQVDRIKNNKMSAPAVCVDFDYSSSYAQTTGNKIFAYQNIDNIPFPFEIMEKWTQFFILSQYFQGRDLNMSSKKIEMEFCDDIWGGNNVAAWGGGDSLSAPVNWFGTAFLTGLTNWNTSTNWGTFHEINHNFQQNGVLFQNYSHAKTNEVTMVNLSLLDDSGRFRDVYNPTGYNFATSGWSRLENFYSTIKYLIANNIQNTLEYEFQNIILYALGTFNFLDYVRYDNIYNSSSGAFNEIIDLSDWFKLNFWPAISNYSPIWNAGWPTSYNEASAEQRKEIDRISSSYKAFDFVANVYAVGSYLHNSETNEYTYTNDMQSAIDIPANEKYIFDFEKGIVSTNKNFNWSRLKFDSVSKLGAKLSQDPNNNRKLIYTPSKNTAGEIDEFNVSIIPNSFTGKPSNYVGEYIWKIKLRLVPNLPVLSLYKDNIVQNNNVNFYNEYSYLRDESNIISNISSLPNRGLHKVDPYTSNEWNRAKLSFSFVAPKTGTYNFKLNLGGGYGFIINDDNQNSFWWKPEENQYYPNSENLVKSNIYLKRGEMLPLSIYFTYNSLSSSISFNAVCDKEEINVFENCVVQGASDLVSDPLVFLNDKKYKYVPRSIDMNDFQTSLIGLKSSREIDFIPKKSSDGTNNYTFISVDPNVSDIDNKLSGNSRLELWPGTATASLKFDVNFSKKTSIRFVVFKNRSDSWKEARATKIKISDQNGAILYDGVYGGQHLDRSSDYTKIVFDNKYEITKLTFDLINEKTVYENESVLIIEGVYFSDSVVEKINKIFSAQNELINYYGMWKFIENNQNFNLSDINNVSAYSTLQNDMMEFKVFCQSFDFIGQMGLDTTTFDVYVNGKLFQTVDTKNETRIDNAILFSYTTEDNIAKEITVKIVNKKNRRLFFNFIQTYGDKTYIEKI